MRVGARLWLLWIFVLSNPTQADTFADFFSSNSYANQDGNQNWSTSWDESNDNGTPGPPASNNDIGITGGELFLKDGNVEVYRYADLSAYSQATLTFDYREVGFDGNGDRIDVYVGVGNRWTRVLRYRGRNVGSGSAEVDISAYISNNTGILFRSGGGLGDSDYFYVDNVVITTGSNVAQQHIAINHDGNAVSCVAENITFSIHNSSHQVETGYEGTLVVSARDVDTNNLSGSWSAVSVANPTSFSDLGDGRFSYAMTAADNGSITVGYTQKQELTINFDAVSDTIVEGSEDESLTIAATFSEEGFFRDEFTQVGGSYQDNFETVSYSNNDGNLTWTTPWIETEQYSGGSPSSGDVRIVGGRLELTGNNTFGFFFVKSAIEREVDLSGSTTATLRFSMRTTSVESNDIATVAISRDGGVNWTTLGSYNDDISTWRPFSFDISSYISNNTRIRFRIEDESGSRCCFGPADEILQIEDIQILTDPAGTYANNDGDLLFSGDWIESDGTGPADGEVSIYLDALYMYGNSRSVTSLSRSMDLSRYDDAVLTFDYQAIGSVDAEDKVELEVNAGSGWENLTTFAGNTSGQASVSLKDHLSSQTQIRFVIDDPGNGGNCCYNTTDEVFRIDNVNITVYSISSCQGADHFSISHSGQGVHCEPEVITITARDASGNQLVDYEGTLSLSTSTNHGDWQLQSGSGSLNLIGRDGGRADYIYSPADNGQVVLRLSDTHEEGLSINVVDDKGITETSNSATARDDPWLTFSRAVFKFIYGDGSTPATETIPQLTSAMPLSHNLGYDPLKIRAITTDLDTGQCMALFSGLQPIDLALECIEPSTCSALTGSEFSTSSSNIAENNSASVSDYTSVNLSFDASGTATLQNAIYRDAGSIRLHARYVQTGDDVLGNSQTMDVHPAGFCVQSTEPNWECVTADLTCSVFKKAGENFAFEVTAQGWQQDGDSEFCDNAVLLPNFNSDVSLSPNLIAPVGGNNGTLQNNQITLSNGRYTGSQSWNEVGVLQIQAGGNSYLNGALPTSTSQNIGRFIPYEFYIVAHDDGSYGDAQTGFSYVGQTDLSGNGGIKYDSQPWFEFIVRDANGNTIQNYQQGGFFNNPTSVLSPSTATLGADAVTPLVLNAGFDGPTISYDPANYRYRYTLSNNDHFLFAKNSNAQIDSFTNDIELTLSSLSDDDNIDVVNPLTLTPTGGVVRYGRLHILNAYGPETEPLSQIWQAEYFNGSDFVPNTLDSSTQINSADVVGGSVTITDIGLSTNPLQASDAVLSGVTTLTLGRSELTWSTPTNGRYGSFEYEFTVHSWLQHDWTGGAQESPTGRVSFGRYRGHDRMIYWKEITY